MDERRVLLAKRISDDKGERSDSIEAQDKKLRRRVFEEGVIIAGETEDLSVSGDVDMMNRPALGQWLTEEGREQWDELWVTNQDRLSRSEPHFMSFVFKMLEWGKEIHVLDDPEFTKQMRTPEGRAILHVKSLGPHKELERIKARNQDSHDNRRYTVRWPGGIPPFGYVVEHRFENGKTAAYLKVDEDMSEVLHEMRRLMVAGQSFTGVSRYLNDANILTSRDRARVRKGKPVGRRGKQGVPESWSESSVKFLLTDESLLGRKKHRREVLYNEDGTHIQLADPIFTVKEWDTLQAAIQKRLMTNERRVNGTSPMYGVVYCSTCNSKGRHKVTPRGDGVTYRYYNCGAWPKAERCAGIACRAEIVEELVEIHFLQEYGRKPVTKRVWVPGNDQSKQVEEIDKRITRLRRQDEDGDWDEDREGYRSRMDDLKGQRAKLAAVPTQKSGWVEQDQGVTFLELWPTLDLEGQRLRLIEAGYRVMIGLKTAWLHKAPLEDA